jgi:hypothetical protein
MNFQPPDSLGAWQAIGAGFPFGNSRFRGQWAKWFELGESANYPIGESMERCITHCQDQKISVPPHFFELKRSIEEVEAEHKIPFTETNQEKARRLERNAGLK